MKKWFILSTMLICFANQLYAAAEQSQYKSKDEVVRLLVVDHMLTIMKMDGFEDQGSQKVRGWVRGQFSEVLSEATSLLEYFEGDNTPIEPGNAFQDFWTTKNQFFKGFFTHLNKKKSHREEEKSFPHLTENEQKKALYPFYLYSIFSNLLDRARIVFVAKENLHTMSLDVYSEQLPAFKFSGRAPMEQLELLSNISVLWIESMLLRDTAGQKVEQFFNSVFEASVEPEQDPYQGLAAFAVNILTPIYNR